MNIDKKANQAEFEALLRSVNRDGMDYVIEDLDAMFINGLCYQVIIEIL